MGDQSGRVTDASTSTPAPVQTSHNPFAGLLDKAHHAATSAYNSVSEKAHEIASDPNVKKQVANTTHIATNMGVDVAHGVVKDGQGMATDVHNGNYAGAALKAAPLLVGGPAGLIAKEVAPKVVAAGMKQLPEGTRHQIESTGAGRMAMAAVEQGHIPTSPAEIARMAAENAKKGTFDAALKQLAARPATQPPATTGGETHVAKPNVVNQANQVFPDWMHPHQSPTSTDATKH
jgi:hypothetical protein